MKRILLFMGLLIITAWVWPIGFYLAGYFFIYDVMLGKEDRANEEKELQMVYRCLDEANRKLEETAESEYQKKKEIKFKKIMEENTRGFNRKSKMDNWL